MSELFKRLEEGKNAVTVGLLLLPRAKMPVVLLRLVRYPRYILVLLK